LSTHLDQKQNKQTKSSVKLDSAADVEELRDWLAAAFDYMAMGNYPYKSGYMLNGNGALPAFPMRVACKRVVPKRGGDEEGGGGDGGDDEGEPSGDDDQGDSSDDDDDDDDIELVARVAAAAGVFYNYSRELACFDPGFGPNPETDEDGDFWVRFVCLGGGGRRAGSAFIVC
jgi:lysosomal Pro-X carboxypeptidase